MNWIRKLDYHSLQPMYNFFILKTTQGYSKCPFLRIDEKKYVIYLGDYNS